MTRLIPFTLDGEATASNREIYVPHPYTNWSLNPAFACQGEAQHTIEGFRRSGGEGSTVGHFAARGKRPGIWCLGGSTTYCTGIGSWRDTWPAMLSGCLSAAGGPEIVVANAGVGGWNSLQSLIRLVTWGPVLRPELVIVYNTKNDLSPLWQGDPAQTKVWPDYQNVVGQFSAGRRGWAWWRRRDIGLVYGGEGRPAGLARFDDDLMTAILARHQAILDLVGQWGGRVVVMPELINGSAYAEPMQRIHARLSEQTMRHSTARWFDLTAQFQPGADMMQDKMHFNTKGCAAFAEILARWLAVSHILA